MRDLITKVLLSTLAAVLTMGCGDATGRLPGSTGRPSEVLLAGDTSGIVAAALGEDTEALPQSEPMFDVSRSRTDRLNATERLERNIVVTDINPRLFTRTSVRYERNVYAAPQIIVYISAPSAEAIRRDISRCHIERLLLQNELTAYATRLQKHHNRTIEDELRRTFGCDILVPEDMKVNLRGRNFIWLSDNNPVKMGNICLYTSENRDSVMRINLKGETDLMFMSTVAGSVASSTGTTRDGLKVTIRRGLWQMEGDAMGGPFMSRAIHTARGHVVVAEAFVFAPGEKKRDIMRRLEASVQTMRPADKSRKSK